MTLSALLEALHIDSHPAYHEEIYPAAALEYAAQGCVYTTEYYLSALDSEFDALAYCREDILRAAAAIRGQELLERYTVLLAHAMRRIPDFFREFDALRLPPAPDGADPLPYEMTGFFALLSTVHDEARELRRRGVPEDVISATVQGHAFSLFNFKRGAGRAGFAAGRMNWCTNFMPPSATLSIGRFNFAPGRFWYPARFFRSRSGAYRVLMCDTRIHRSGLILGSPGAEDEEGAFDADFIETDEWYEGYSPAPVTPGQPVRILKTRYRLAKSGWTQVFGPGDGFLVTHIPSALPFGHEVQLESYRRAREIYAKCYPELGIRGIHCRSWLIAPQLQGFLRPDSNIALFQRDHLLYPCPCTGRDVFSHLFLSPVERFEDLPQNTSMERGVRELYLSGSVLYETAGFNITPEANDPV